MKAERSGQGQYFHYDWRGDVIALTDPTEQAIQTYNYDAFGTVTDSSGSAVNPYQFSSKQYDGNSGLSYFGRRHYSSGLGRFTTQDPKEYVDGLNTYAYVKNNPVNRIDRLGNSACLRKFDVTEISCDCWGEGWLNNVICNAAQGLAEQIIEKTVNKLLDKYDIACDEYSDSEHIIYDCNWLDIVVSVKEWPVEYKGVECKCNLDMKAEIELCSLKRKQ